MERIIAKVLLFALPLLLAFSCDEGTSSKENDSSENGDSDESDETEECGPCKTWAASGQDWDLYPNSDERIIEIREEIKAAGGGLFGINETQYYIVWTPENWEEGDQTLTILANNGRMTFAEEMWSYWREIAEDNSFILVTLQYYDAPIEETSGIEAEESIVDLAYAVLEESSAHCPISKERTAFYGYSFGSTQIPDLALYSYLTDPNKRFATYIIDSGAPLAEFKIDLDDPYLTGARFWMYCGEKDGDICEQMTDLQNFILSYGGRIDAFYRDPTGGHGLFGSPTAAEIMTALIDYLRSL